MEEHLMEEYLMHLSNQELREVYNGALRQVEYAYQNSTPNVEEFWSQLGYVVFRILADRMGLDQTLDYLEAPIN